MEYYATGGVIDSNKLFDSLMEVNKMYHPNGQPVVFDLQLEAEILGCYLVWAKDCHPSVSSNPLAEIMTIPCHYKLSTDKSGRLRKRYLN